MFVWRPEAKQREAGGRKECGQITAAEDKHGAGGRGRQEQAWG